MNSRKLWYPDCSWKRREGSFVSPQKCREMELEDASPQSQAGGQRHAEAAWGCRAPLGAVAATLVGAVSLA